MKLAEALDEVTKTQERMIQHERLRALGQMGSGIAHDFNNALMPIVGFTQFLLAHPETLDDKEGLKSTLTDINEAAVNAKEIVRRLSQFYKPATNGKRESVDLNHAIERAVALTKPIWREEKGGKGVPIEVRTKLGMNIPHVRGSEAELSEVLTNMILNSIDAMPQGGLVTISSTADDRHAILSVADTGMGMSEEVRRQCMEPFFSTKGEKGTGLGLSMVHGIVRRHRGNMEIRSLPGRGTTVELRLPVIFEAGDKKEHVVAVETVRSLKILVIDDDMWTRDLMKLLLEADNHEVDVAQTGTEGLTQFARQEYDLVMTDRAMPDMSGDQVAAAVKKVNPAMPVVLLTGFGDVMKDEGELPEGIDSILSKPVTQAELQHAIRSVIDPQGPPSEP
jgi:nitrogen-specific signal transduction histidine kinase/ActR/RegA family two-component response regulator